MIGPPHPGVPLAYGTAGFRARADLLDSTFFRMGALAVLRSRSRGGLAVGLMVTASHNAEPDNGIKLVDPDGGMLDVSWEPHASAVANAADADLAAVLDAVADAVGVVSAGGGRVLVARDTRPHSERLSALALDGVSHLGGAGEDFGLLTTPQLHHIVRHANGGAAGGAHVGPAAWASEGGYAEMLCTAFAALLPPDLGGGGLRAPLTVDCACGVGGPQLAPIAQRLAPLLPLELINRPGEGELNAGCGAEFVQKGRLPPRGLDTPPPTTSADSGGGGGGGGSRLCSLDGDADRVVFHYWRLCAGAVPEWRLLDGDKIAALFAAFVCDELRALEIEPALSVACVQTAYANGASGAHLRSLGVPTPLARTGVKHVHHAALRYDVSVYFEANGHGTLLFSDSAVSAIAAARQRAEASGDAGKAASAARLLAAKQLVNQAIGDAISAILLVEAILLLRGWSIERWDAIYEDLPSRQAKLGVADRAALRVNEDETRTLEPAELQREIDALAATHSRGRAFVRPSGTEDVVRVYAEAATQQAADELARKVGQATWRLAGGVGEQP